MLLIPGLLTLAGTIVGGVMGYILSARQQARDRRIQYTRDALQRVREFADQMEVVAHDILFLLVGFALWLSKKDRDEIGRSLDRVRGQIIQTPWLPEVRDAGVEKAWHTTSQMLGKLFLTYVMYPPALPFRTGEATRRRSPENIRKFYDALLSNDYERLRNLIATDEHSVLLYEATKDLLHSVILLREEIRRASTIG